MDGHAKVVIYISKRIEDKYDSYERNRGAKFWIAVEKNNIKV